MYRDREIWILKHNCRLFLTERSMFVHNVNIAITHNWEQYYMYAFISNFCKTLTAASIFVHFHSPILQQDVSWQSVAGITFRDISIEYTIKQFITNAKTLQWLIGALGKLTLTIFVHQYSCFKCSSALSERYIYAYKVAEQRMHCILLPGRQISFMALELALWALCSWRVGHSFPFANCLYAPLLAPQYIKLS